MNIALTAASQYDMRVFKRLRRLLECRRVDTVTVAIPVTSVVPAVPAARALHVTRTFGKADLPAIYRKLIYTV